MQEQFDIRTENMPEEMRTLLAEYPRDDWDAHPGFRENTRHWLGAHEMFRRVARLVRSDTEAFLDNEMENNDYAGRLSFYGNRLIGNLHGHHHWEDMDYFPELSAADPRFDAGLEILEKDHEALNRVLDRFAEAGNRTIQLIQLDENQVRDEAGKLHKTAEAIEAFLARHLSDEEELAVPIILHHRLRG